MWVPWLDYIHLDHHAPRRQAYADLGNTISLTTISLQDFLTSNNAPQEIDYLSIATEGSEYEILKHFPIDNWRIKCLTIEHIIIQEISNICLVYG